MNKFTLIVHNKGWTVKDACAHWGIRYETFNKRCNSDKMHNQLESMCRGLEGKIELNVTIYFSDVKLRDK